MLANASSIPGYVWPAFASRPEYDCNTSKLPPAADADGSSVGSTATAVADFLGATIGGTTSGNVAGDARSISGRDAAPPIMCPSRNENVPAETSLGGSGIGGGGGIAGITGGTIGCGITAGATGCDGGSIAGRDAAGSTNAGSGAAGSAAPTTTRSRFDGCAGFALGGGSACGVAAASATAVAADCAALDALDAIVAVRRSASVMLYSR